MPLSAVRRSFFSALLGSCAALASLSAQTPSPDISAGPDPREIPLPVIATAFAPLPGPDQLPARPELPDALVMNDGSPVTTAAQWQHRRQEIRTILEYYAVGHLPPAPGNLKSTVVSSQSVLEGRMTYRLIRLNFGPDQGLELNIGVFTPTAGEAVPMIIAPGGTPPGATVLPRQPQGPGQGKGVNALLTVGAGPKDPQAEAALASRVASRALSADALAARYAEVFQRGYGIVTFDPNDCAEDTTLRRDDGSWAFRHTRFPQAYPEYDWGVLGAWAWGVSRIVDYLVTDPAVDRTKLIVTGVSRTGKSAMIAAAFDDRIAMGAPVVTGGGGLGAYRFSGIGRGGKEGLGEMMNKYPNWFSPQLRPFWGHTDKLPFDAHWFLALCAPRAFIALEGDTDGVSLANAVKQSILGAKPVYALLDATDRLGVNYAKHGHALTADDWTAMLDFADRHLRGRNISRSFDQFLPEPAPASPEAK